MEEKIRLFSTVTILTVLFGLAVFSALGVVPLGPSSFQDDGDTRQLPGAYPAGEHDAYAGNLTQLTIEAISQTKHWQGYFGEISGTVVLDDADNYTFYDWPNTEPKGEVYATINSTTPVWSSVSCFNYVAGIGSGESNLTVWENFYNMTYNDVDGLDETFNMTQHPIFDIGDVVTIAEDTCPSTFTHVNDAFQEDKFVELLLMDNGGRLIFSTIIENDDEANNSDPKGFDNRTHDFQLLVAEDGTSRTGGNINTDKTTYYFYLDLE